MDVREAEVAALEAVGELLVINAHAVQDGRVQIVDVDRIFDDIVTVVVGLAEAETGLDSAAGHPDRITAAMVIAAIVIFFNFSLAIDGAAKFAAPDDQGVFKQTARL